MIEQGTFDFAPARRAQRMRSNSIKAYHAERGSLSTRALAILTELQRGGGGTDRELMARLGFKEPNAVRPRITELIEMKLVRVERDVRCPTTGKTVRRVAAAQSETPADEAGASDKAV